MNQRLLPQCCQTDDHLVQCIGLYTAVPTKTTTTRTTRLTVIYPKQPERGKITRKTKKHIQLLILYICEYYVTSLTFFIY